jgi:hypothetical protein
VFRAPIGDLDMPPPVTQFEEHKQREFDIKAEGWREETIEKTELLIEAGTCRGNCT